MKRNAAMLLGGVWGFGPAFPFSRYHGSTEKWEHACVFPTKGDNQCYPRG